MKKLLILALVGALLGVVGCASTGDKPTDEKDGASKTATNPGTKGEAPYVGKYAMLMSDADKKQMEAQFATMPADKKAEAMKKMDEAIKKMEISINADGTFEMTGSPDGKDVKGTYTAEGNTLTITPTEGTDDKKPGKITYNEADQTLTKEDSKMVFKKK